MPSDLAQIRIVLVETEFPGNVGAAARALQTMGLSQLVLVNPKCEAKGEEASRLAHAAVSVLNDARVVTSLEEAIGDTVFSVATSRRVRRHLSPLYTPEEAARLVLERSGHGPVAIVFGRESWGLDNTELERCSIHSTIPSATETQSLNLAQSVMIYAYSVYQASLAPAERSFGWSLATNVQVEKFYEHLAETLGRLGTRPSSNMENLITRFRRVLSRLPLEGRDVQLLHKLLSQMDFVAGKRRDEVTPRVESPEQHQ